MIDKYSATWKEVAKVAQDEINKLRSKVESTAGQEHDDLIKTIGRIQAYRQILNLENKSDE